MRPSRGACSRSTWGRTTRPSSTTGRLWPNEAGQPTPRLGVTLSRAELGFGAPEVIEALWARDPRIAVLPGLDDTLFMTPDTLNAGEASVVLDAVADVIRTGLRPAAAEPTGALAP